MVLVPATRIASSRVKLPAASTGTVPAVRSLTETVTCTEDAAANTLPVTATVFWFVGDGMSARIGAFGGSGILKVNVLFMTLPA